MSLILDALRKSEAERRRGQAPDLFAPAGVARAQRVKPPIAMIGVALAAMLAAAIIVFWPSQPTRPVPAAVTPAATETAAAAPPTATEAAIPVLPSPVLRMPKSRVAPPENAGARDAPPIAAAPEIAKPAEPVTDVAAAPDDVAGNLAKPELTDPAPSIDEPALPTLATLDSGARAALPPLQLSMHVWSPDVSRRFAIIDGQRLGEGGKLAGAVVAQIRRDGVVLSLADGRQFLLPRP